MSELAKATLAAIANYAEKANAAAATALGVAMETGAIQ